MAQDLQVKGVGVKRRGPVVTWLLILVTLGIYALFHWYFMNREMRDVSEALGNGFGNNPVMSVLAIFPGAFLIVPTIWTWVTTAQRARDLRVMALDGRPGEVTSVPLGVLLGLISALNHPYLQASLNASYDLLGATEA